MYPAKAAEIFSVRSASYYFELRLREQKIRQFQVVVSTLMIQVKGVDHIRVALTAVKVATCPKNLYIFEEPPSLWATLFERRPENNAGLAAPDRRQGGPTLLRSPVKHTSALGSRRTAAFLARLPLAAPHPPPMGEKRQPGCMTVCSLLSSSPAATSSVGQRRPWLRMSRSQLRVPRERHRLLDAR